uniref:Uncharacterized protein LOC104243878 n=1 Tax=Nicotiana sylvestris TaxID=4096 RepID=A0A1U7Y654_NICSY|nr:PREDICTED: uncharacterized protein LOC104243878 [Nicotiana sylvestris]
MREKLVQIQLQLQKFMEGMINMNERNLVTGKELMEMRATINKFSKKGNGTEIFRAEYSTENRGCLADIEPERRARDNHVNQQTTGYQTIRVTGYHEKRPLQVLIDTGSIHNFIDQDMAKKLGCKTSSIMAQSISVADGRRVQTASICKNLQWFLQGTTFSSNFLLSPLVNMDIVLGVQWLNTLGKILFNFRNRTIEFMYHGKKHVLSGATNQLKSTKAKTVNKIEGDNTRFLC